MNSHNQILKKAEFLKSVKSELVQKNIQSVFSYFDEKLKKSLGGKGLSRFSLVRSYKEFANSSFHSDHAMVLGNQMFLDANDFMDLTKNGVFEPMSTKIILNEIGGGKLSLMLVRI